LARVRKAVVARALTHGRAYQHKAVAHALTHERAYQHKAVAHALTHERAYQRKAVAHALTHERTYQRLRAPARASQKMASSNPLQKSALGRSAERGGACVRGAGVWGWERRGKEEMIARLGRAEGGEAVSSAMNEDRPGPCVQFLWPPTTRSVHMMMEQVCVSACHVHVCVRAYACRRLFD